MMYSNYAINISVIIDSMMPAFTKTLQFISVTVLKIIFKRHTGKATLWTHGLDAQNLDAWTLGLCTLGLCKSGRLDSGRMDSASLDAWTLGLWKTGRLDSGRLGAWTVDVWNLDDWKLRLWMRSDRRCLRSGCLHVWTLDACTLILWTFGRLDSRLSFNNYTFATKVIL